MSSILDVLRREMPSLTRTERMIALELMRSYPSAGLETVAEFARRAGTSSPSILRFVAKLKFRSYADFQSQLRAEVSQVLQSPLSRSSAMRGKESVAEDSFGAAAVGNISRAVELLDAVDMDAVVSLVADERRPLFLIGGRFSKANALWTYQLLRDIRGNIRLVEEEPANYAHSLLAINRTSVLIAFDYRRYQEDIVAYAAAARQRRATLIAVTDEWLSPIAAQAAHVFTTPVAAPSLFDSTIGSLVQMEALIARTAEALGQKAATRIAAVEVERERFSGDVPAKAKPAKRKI
ncbi:MurR/RpiR family transcriptional regulator [Aureimonas fodinaquatilis]|nr:MurR/RpiR family transcriptional regulator [Aureimonas fodinaquatilis]